MDSCATNRRREGRAQSFLDLNEKIGPAPQRSRAAIFQCREGARQTVGSYIREIVHDVISLAA